MSDKFTLDDKEYEVANLTDDQKVMLRLIVEANAKLQRIDAEVNLINIGKDVLVKQLKEQLENDNSED